MMISLTLRKRGLYQMAYGNWALSDSERIAFLHEMYLKWLSTEDSFKDEYDKLAINPSNVFGLNSQEH